MPGVKTITGNATNITTPLIGVLTLPAPQASALQQWVQPIEAKWQSWRGPEPVLQLLNLILEMMASPSSLIRLLILRQGFGITSTPFITRISIARFNLSACLQ